MNLLFLVDLQGRSAGGGFYSIFKFGEALARLGNTVHLFWIEKPNLYQEQGVPNLSIHTRAMIPMSFRGSLRLNRFLDRVFYAAFLRRFIKKHRGTLDFIIGHQTRTALKAVRFGNEFRIRTANFVFETPNWLFKKIAAAWGKKWKDRRLKRDWDEFRHALLRTNLVFPISWSTKMHVEKWISVPVEEPIFPAVDRPTTTEKFSEQRDQVIYVGQLRDHKNIPELIEALSRIVKAPRLIICGTGPEEKRLQHLARQLNVKCDFRGLVSDREKWRLIAESKFMVFPTSFEGFGMPPMEALVQGVPCICADIPILREVYENRLEYFEEHNIDQLADKIRFLLDHPDYCRERGEEGRAFIEQRFSWEASARKIENILQKALHRSVRESGY